MNMERVYHTKCLNKQREDMSKTKDLTLDSCWTVRVFKLVQDK